MRREIRIAGYGGQGVITLGYVLANAAGIYDGKYTLMTQSYGPEARGGACRSDVIIGDTPIDYPKLSNPECFIAMSIDAYHQFKGNISANSSVILDEDLVQVEPSQQLKGVTYYRIPSLREAEALGNKLAANMVMLGAIQSITGAVSTQAIEQAVKERFPRFMELNLKAVHRGMALGKAAMEEG